MNSSLLFLSLTFLHSETHKVHRDLISGMGAPARFACADPVAQLQEYGFENIVSLSFADIAHALACEERVSSSKDLLDTQFLFATLHKGS